MKKWILRGLCGLNVLTFVGLFILEKLTKTKAGVNHHIIAKTHQWSQSILSQDNLNILSILSITILIFAIIFMIFGIAKEKQWIYFLYLSMLQLALLALIFSNVFIAITSASYLILGLCALTILQISLCIFMLFIHKNRMLT